MGKDARLELMELYGSESARAVIGVTHETMLKGGAFAEINAVHKEKEGTVVLCFFRGRLGIGANMRFNAVYSGGSYTRARNCIDATKKGSKAEVNELVLGSGAQKFDICTYISNSAPETSMQLESRAALAGTSMCVLKGFAKVRHGAEKSDSHIGERGMLLDKGAKIESLPDMSIDENNIKATHSSATAPIDAEVVFYLMSRGVDAKRARKLIVSGFLDGYARKIDNAVMREITASLIDEKIGR